MDRELDKLVQAFAIYTDGRLRELCSDANRDDLFKHYALQPVLDKNDMMMNMTLSAVVDGEANMQRKRMETDRAQDKLEKIFAMRKAPSMTRGGGATRSALGKRPASGASGSTAVVPAPPVKEALPPIADIGALRQALVDFASLLGLDTYEPKL